MSNVSEKLRLIREGSLTETTEDSAEALLESTLDLYLMESDNEGVLLEALSVFDNLGMMIFNKFSKIEKIADANIEQYKDLTVKLRKHGGPVSYRLNSDLSGVIGVKDAMIKLFNTGAVSSKKIFDILGNPEVTPKKFGTDELTLLSDMDADVVFFKTLLKKFKQYSDISNLRYTVTDTEKYDPSGIIQNRKLLIADVLKMRDDFRARIKSYTAQIARMDNPKIPGFKNRLEGLVKKALRHEIYYMTGILRVLMFLFHEDKKILDQISHQVNK